MSARRDKIGRKIGRNQWRDDVWEAWHGAYYAWWLEAEATAIGYATELAEFKLSNPTPTFKSFLIGMAGQRSAPA